jgi:hypothetical protein
MNFAAANLDVWAGTVVPSRSVGCLAVLSFVLGIRSQLSKVVVDREVQYAGRCQVGEDLWLALQAVGQTSRSSGVMLPDATPVVRLYAVGTLPVRAFPLTIDHSSGGSRGLFRGTFRPGGTDAPGRYWAVSQYRSGGLDRESIAAFEVVPGGHRNGAIVATSYVSHPGGKALIAHCEGGTIARGLRPYLDPGD